MILVDERVGSRELLDRIRSYGADAELSGRLSADFQCSGNGPDGSVLVGFERKAIQDLLNSMREKRLAGQQTAPMQLTYEVRYLIVEGMWRRGRDTGLVEVPAGTENGRRQWCPARGSYRWSEAVRFLASMRELGDIRVWRTADEEETAAYIAEEHQWWQKPWDQHRTDRTIYTPEPKVRGVGHKPRMFRREATLLEHWLHALPRIDDRATELSEYFISAGDMATAPVERWLAIKGIGDKTAQEIVGRINRAEGRL